MAKEEANATKVDEQKSKEAAEQGAENSEENLLSLDSLDDIIAKEDPDFAKSLSEIGPDVTAEIYYEGIELEYTLAEEIKLWEASPGKKKFFLKIFPFLPRFTFKYKMVKTSLRLQRVKMKAKLIHYVNNAGPITLEWLKGRIRATKEGIGNLGATFKSFSGVKKVLFVVLVIVTGASVFLIHRIYTKGLIPDHRGLFISSMEEWSQAKIIYDPATQSEAFYDSMRASQSMFAMEKMVVNLRRSANSGPNPMGAFEFYIEGAASEVVVEIKDREPEMIDLFQRTIEEMTFDQVSSGEGKQLLTDKLRKVVNQNLTKGKVRRVFIKTAIVKP